MASQSSSGERRSAPESVPQRSIFEQVLQQAQAAAAAQSDQVTTTRQGTFLQDVDLSTPDDTEDDSPPPAYDDVYGEPRNEKHGLGTNARVTDDGRVNININQLNRRLSQILTPALRQQVRDLRDGEASPLPRRLPVQEHKHGLPPPPPLNIVMQVVGSRGDVQPFVALGKVLQNNYGHRVRLATHPNFRKFVLENGLEFFSIGGDPSQLMAFMVKNPNLMPGARSLLSGDVGQRRRDVAEYIQGCWRSCYQSGDGVGLGGTDDNTTMNSGKDSNAPSAAKPFIADCIIANPPSFAHIHCAEKLGIPLHIMFTMPYSPTQAFPHPLANIQSSNTDPRLTNLMSYAMIEVLSWQGLGSVINRFRKKCLGLDPISSIWAPGMLQRLKVPHTYCWSSALIPKPSDWGLHISVSGFYILDLASKYTPTLELQAFLDAGPAPVYIGFGSIVLDDPNTMTELIFEAVRMTGQRALISKGWGGIGVDELHVPDGVFMLGNVPHDWLFKHVSCVVHHGGAGTTAAGITAGRPTLVVPFFGDQAFWGAMVARAGAGPNPIPHKQLTAKKLADAISSCLTPESLSHAQKLASKIAAERGSESGAQSFHQHLNVDRLRCTLSPSRPAAWRINHTQIRLSTFAACTLANAKLLDFNDLKLFRPQEYETDEGPLDPVSGGATAAFGAFSSMTMGVADFPSETLKMLEMPFALSRKQAQNSTRRTPTKSGVSPGTNRFTPSDSLNQSHTSSSVQDPLAGFQSSVNSYGVTSPTSNGGPNSTVDASQGRTGSEQIHDKRSGFSKRHAPSSDKDHDMMRPTGVHVSKGLGRIVRAAFQAPVEISMNVTRGFHNAPKLWGDDTVRPQEQVGDFKSGVRAAGREFGFGMYDGVTGLVTQPWRGGQKEGASGVLKGIGKGIGGFATKPSAALMGVLGFTMKGVHKEVQRLFGGNVQNYIIASRTAQGYEEWLRSSETEKQDVVTRWKSIQNNLSNRSTADEMIRDALEAQRSMNTTDREAHRDPEHTASTFQSTSGRARSIVSQSVTHASGGDSQSREEYLGPVGVNGAIHAPTEELVDRDRLSSAIVEPENHARQEITATEVEDQQDARDQLEYDRKTMRVITQSLEFQRQSNSDSDWESNLDHDDEGDEEYDGQLQRATRRPGKMAENAGVVAGGQSSTQRPPSYDPGHLAGITRSDFEAQGDGHRAEKSKQERTEEEIVMEYVKKQSILEMHHRTNGKGRATATEGDYDKDLEQALKLSLQKTRHDPGSENGGSSRG